jgi:hypothetical protein
MAKKKNTNWGVVALIFILGSLGAGVIGYYRRRPRLLIIETNTKERTITVQIDYQFKSEVVTWYANGNSTYSYAGHNIQVIVTDDINQIDIIIFDKKGGNPLKRTLNLSNKKHLNFY